MAKRRVVITGLGVVSCLGLDVETFWENLLAGKSGISTIEAFDTSKYTVHFGGEIRDFDSSNFMSPKEAKRQDKFTQYAYAGSVQAMKDSGLDPEKCDLKRIGVIIGSGIGGMAVFQAQSLRLETKGPKWVSPFFVPKLMMNAAPAHISIAYGFQGPNYAVSSACASSNHAFADALRTIKNNEADAILTGGCEAALTSLGLAGFCSLRALSTRNDDPEGASRPFDAERDGFVLSEGAGVVVFEELEHAKKRGAKIYAEVLGAGMSADAYHITAPAPDASGAIVAFEAALNNAEINKEDVSYINAHGTSTAFNDAIETKAIKTVFGDYAKQIPISSTKSMIGHLLGAAGAVEMVALAKSVYHNKIHQTKNYENVDPECDLDYVPEGPRDCKIKAALSNSLGFGGHNATVVVGKYND